MTKVKGPLLLAAAATIWGGMYVVSKFTFSAIPPMTLLFIRYLIAGVVLTAVCLVRREWRLSRRDIASLVQIGVVGYFLSISAQFIGTDLADAHTGALITTLSPIFLSFFAVILLKEAITAKQAAALAIATAGVFFIVGGPGRASGQTVGLLILLFAAASWGYYSAIAKKAAKFYTPLQMTTAGIWMATVLSFPFAAFQWQTWDHGMLAEPSILLGILYLGIVSTAGAFFAWNRGLELTPSHHAGLYFFLQPLTAALFGRLFLGESLGGGFWIGGLFIAGGVILSQWQKTNKPGVKEKKPHFTK
ncbi:DMT family transporter [Caenibacillus caldisaponilyticus]|uniref:DMT family transporter n=1 Tax=Caenibacillus caldisaponilyticus TaxID=1674942 RepID=UPI0009888CE5|nr:EamA family transporter [Caenibacillus caldisaponilyticus]